MYRPSRLLTKNDGVVPRNVYRRSLVRPHLLPSKASLLRSRKRPARTPPSTFLFLPIHLSNSPGTMAIPLPGTPGSRRSSSLPTEIGRLVTLSVRSFAGAPSRRKAGGAPLWALYRRRLSALSTAEQANFPATPRCEKGPARPLPSGFCGVGAPHWRHIPPALFASGKGQWSRYESKRAWLEPR